MGRRLLRRLLLAGAQLAGFLRVEALPLAGVLLGGGPVVKEWGGLADLGVWLAPLVTNSDPVWLGYD
jgi:hypothetical protein